MQGAVQYLREALQSPLTTDENDGCQQVDIELASDHPRKHDKRCRAGEEPAKAEQLGRVPRERIGRGLKRSNRAIGKQVKRSDDRQAQGVLSYLGRRRELTKQIDQAKRLATLGDTAHQRPYRFMAKRRGTTLIPRVACRSGWRQRRSGG